MGYRIIRKNGTEYITFEIFDGLDWLIHGFSTRIGGVSEGYFDSMNLSFTVGDKDENVKANYTRIMKALQISSDHDARNTDTLVFSKQIHSDNIARVESADAGNGFLRENKWTLPESGGADGLITDSSDVTLVTYYADCVPIFLADPIRKSICLVHAGWRGTAMNIAAKAVKRMNAEFGSRPHDLLAAIGPSIGVCHFETHSEVAEAFGGTAGEYAEFVRKSTQHYGKYNIDLKGINKKQLSDAGVQPSNIDIADICTACSIDKFFSHRIMGALRGSMAAFMKIL